MSFLKWTKAVSLAFNKSTFIETSIIKYNISSRLFNKYNTVNIEQYNNLLCTQFQSHKLPLLSSCSTVLEFSNFMAIRGLKSWLWRYGGTSRDSDDTGAQVVTLAIRGNKSCLWRYEGLNRDTCYFLF